MGQAKTAKSKTTAVGGDVRAGGATATAPRPANTRTTAGTKSRASAKAAAITRDQISQRAREIWIKNGCKPGQDEQNWHEAERQLKAEKAGK